MKLAVVVGHNAISQGAVSVDGTSEFIWNSQLAELIKDISPREVEIFYRVHGGGYSREIDRVYAQVDKYSPDVSVELHFNGSASASASGCLTLSSGSSGSLRLAQNIQQETLRVLQNRNRGVEVRQKSDRGGRSLWAGKAPAVMTEPFFGSNAEDWRRANARIDQLAEAVFVGAERSCG